MMAAYLRTRRCSFVRIEVWTGRLCMVPEVMVMGRRSGVCNGWVSGSSQCSFYIIYLLSTGYRVRTFCHFEGIEL